MVLMSFIIVITACNTQPAIQERSNVTFEQLIDDPEKYHGVDIEIEGYYFQGFETIVLSERLEPSGFAEGHLVPKGFLIWIEGGIPREIYDELNQQAMMGPVERYGKVRVSGVFEYGGKYGHLGQFEYNLKPTVVQMIEGFFK